MSRNRKLSKRSSVREKEIKWIGDNVRTTIVIITLKVKGHNMPLSPKSRTGLNCKNAINNFAVHYKGASIPWDQNQGCQDGIYTKCPYLTVEYGTSGEDYDNTLGDPNWAR